MGDVLAENGKCSVHVSYPSRTSTTTTGSARCNRRLSSSGVMYPAPVTGAAGMMEDAGLTFEAEHAVVNIGFARQDTGIVYQVAGGKVVAAIDDLVVLADHVQGISPGNCRLMGPAVNMRIELA